MHATASTSRTIAFQAATNVTPDHASVSPSLLVVHGEDLSIGTPLVNKVAGSIFSRNGYPVATLGDGIQSIFQGEVVRSVLEHLHDQGHLLIHVHGNDLYGSHNLLMANDKGRVTKTRQLLDKLCVPQASNAIASSGNIRRPMVHLTACDTKILRKELRPGTPEWQAGYVMLYSRKGTFIEQYQSSLQTALTYVVSCRQRAIACDPLKLFLLAGQRRGHCLTLLGGELAAPLVWHSPKTLHDLDQERVFDKLEGEIADKNRLMQTVSLLDAEEIACMNAVDDALIKQNMLFDRIALNDVQGMCELLRAHPEQLYAKGMLTESPLFFALEFENNQCGQKLIELHADTQLIDKDGMTPLMYAARTNNSMAAMTLLTHRAAINHQDHDGNTALMYAVSTQSYHTLRILMHYRADVLIRNNENNSALSLARELNDNNKAMKILVGKEQ